MMLLALGCASQDKSNSSSTSGVDTALSDAVNTNMSTFVDYSESAVTGQSVYIPVYSHIYQRNQQRTFNLTTTLSIRNTDLHHSIDIKKVVYYDSNGNLVHTYLDTTQSMPSLSSIAFVVEEEDLRGGVGANFLVLWEASQQVSEPIIEAVMISTAQQQGISFVSVGRVINSLERSSQ